VLKYFLAFSLILNLRESWALSSKEQKNKTITGITLHKIFFISGEFNSRPKISNYRKKKTKDF
jgi:hypothetical protein